MANATLLSTGTRSPSEDSKGSGRTLKRSNPPEPAALANSVKAEDRQSLSTYCCCGREILIRPIGHEGDCQRLNRYFSCLSRDSAHSRLCVLGAPLAAQNEHHCSSGRASNPRALPAGGEATDASRRRNCQRPNEFTLIAVVGGETGDQRIVGEACYVVDPGCEGQAEAAISVADVYQRHGLGRALARSLIEAAHANGVMRLAVYVLADNYPALRTFISLGFKAVLWQPGILKMVLELANERPAQDFMAEKTMRFADRASGTLDQIPSIIANGRTGVPSVSNGGFNKPPQAGSKGPS